MNHYIEVLFSYSTILVPHLGNFLFFKLLSCIFFPSQVLQMYLFHFEYVIMYKLI